MTEYIEREALLKEIAEIHKRHGLPEDEEMEFSETDIRGLLLCLPAADVAPVRRGRWIDRYGGRFENALHECSECKTCALYKPERDVLGSVRFVQELSEYCPHCGAWMDGGGGND